MHLISSYDFRLGEMRLLPEYPQRLKIIGNGGATMSSPTFLQISRLVGNHVYKTCLDVKLFFSYLWGENEYIVILLFISLQGPRSWPFFQLEKLSLSSSFPYGVNGQIFDFVCKVSCPWLSLCRLSCYCNDKWTFLCFPSPPHYSLFSSFTQTLKRFWVPSAHHALWIWQTPYSAVCGPSNSPWRPDQMHNAWNKMQGAQGSPASLQVCLRAFLLLQPPADWKPWGNASFVSPILHNLQ